MKLGLILHNYGENVVKASGYNIGDPIQSIALQQLYHEMNVPNDDIIKINLNEIASYEGDYVLLPMLGIAIGSEFSPLPLSPKIIPLFISSHFIASELSPEAVNYLKTYEPIGCRDEYSLNTMRKYGISAFLSGCITTIFNRRSKVNPENIYLVDIPKSLDNYLPSNIKKHAIRKTHLLPLKNDVMTTDIAERLFMLSEERLNEYKQSAKLVISSRMHALVPCMAMGIPVIAAFENISNRFSWLDKYIHLYTEDEFKSIDWNPLPIEYENTKIDLKNLFINSIKQAYHKYNQIYSISNFYENRKKALYGNRYISVLKNIHKSEEKFDYIIWGCGLIGNNVYEIMKKLYPNARLKVAIDEYIEGYWHGVEIIKSDNLVKYPECLVILATYSGKVQGYKTMKRLGKEEFKDYIYLGTING